MMIRGLVFEVLFLSMIFQTFYVSLCLVSAIAESSSPNFAQHILHRSRRQLPRQGRAEEEGCSLPPPLENGQFSLSYKRCPPSLSTPACKMISGAHVPVGWELFYSCDPGHILNSTQSVSYCVGSRWSPSLPDCIAGEPCPPLKSLYVNVNCSFQGQTVSCDHSMKPGTIAFPECKQKYRPVYKPDYKHLTCLNNGYWDYPLLYCTPDELCPPLKSHNMHIQCIFQDKVVPCDQQVKPWTIAIPRCNYNYKPAHDPGYSNITCLNNGIWDRPLFSCVAECGASNEVGHLSNRIVDGVEAHVGAFPWHAGLYYRQVTDGKVTWEQKCGGSLITDQFVLTAAHCAVGRNETGIRIALGKFYRSWDINEDTEEKRLVSRILYPGEFSDKTYTFDIALLLLDKKIKIGEFIMPVCLGFLDGYKYIKNNQLFVVGWGQTDNTLGGKVSETLLYNDVTALSPKDCRREAPTVFPMFDKVCTSKDGSGVSIAQQGDSGGGLTSVYDGLHYIFGIVSIKFSKYTYFTNITWSSNMIWLEDKVREYHPTFSWIANEITTFHNGSRSCMLPEESTNRKFCSLDEGCEDCDRHDRKCFIPPGSQAERIRVVCSPGYRLKTPYSVGNLATCLSGGSWYPRIAECIKVTRDKYIPGDPWRRVSWKNAKENCEAKGNQLAIVKTRDQQLWFAEDTAKYFRDKGEPASATWIGLTDGNGDERFEWLNGSVLRKGDYSKWQPNEPNSFKKENCVQAVPEGGPMPQNSSSKVSYQWNDISCSELNLYFCMDGESGNLYIPGNPWNQVTWQEAKDNCQANGYQLPIILNEEKQNEFEAAISNHFWKKGVSRNSVWLGLRARRRGFEWVDGSVMGVQQDDVVNWLPGEPSNNDGRENCVTAVAGSDFFPKGANGKPYQWNDASCSPAKNYYFCEEITDMPGKNFVPGDPWSKVIWKEARDNCRVLGYQLATIKTSDEQEQFKKVTANHFRQIGIPPSSLWIGLSDERRFDWVDGTVLSFTQWQLDEPSNSNRGSCVLATGENHFKWNDDSCSALSYYFCFPNSHMRNSSDILYTPGKPWEMVTWGDARKNCQAEEKDLAVITSQEQQKLFEEAATKQFKGGTTPGNIWIGLRDEGKFEWVDGSAPGFTPWIPGEPSGGERCVESVIGFTSWMWPEGEVYQWNDTPCSDGRYYFCIEKRT